MRSMHTDRLLAFLFCALLGTVIAGCSLPVYRRHLPALTDSAALITEILGHENSPHELTIFCQSIVTSPRGGAKSKNVIKVRQPDKIRIEFLGFMDHPVAIATADNETLSVALLSEGKHFTGSPDQENLAKVFGIAMPVHDVVLLLLGVPRIETTEFQCVPDGRVYRCTNDVNNCVTTLFINPDRYGLVAYERSVAYPPARHTVSYAKFKKVADRPLPHHITITDPYRGMTVTLRYISVSTEPVSADDFHQHPLPGSECHSIESLHIF